MKTLVNIARYHLVDRLTYVALPWGVMAFSLLVNVVISVLIPPSPHGYYTGGLVTIYLFLLFAGAQSMTRSLPFGMMLGASRRGYYLGTGLLVVTLAVVYGLGLTVLQLVERGTGGWGYGVHFFRVPWILAGPWYLTWLTSFVLLVVFWLYGMWCGLVYRRWSLLGLTAFFAAQVLVALAVVVVVSLTHNWAGFADFFSTVTAPALTGVLAAAAGVLGLGGLATMRRVTI
jgi:hypothetical protein